MVKIYTISDKRPDFIKLQHEGFVKYLQDTNYEFIVCNNGSKPELREEIESICSELKIKTLYVKGEEADGAIATQVPLQYCFKNYILNDSKEDISVIIDSDIFLFNLISLSGENDDKNKGAERNDRQRQQGRVPVFQHKFILNAFYF